MIAAVRQQVASQWRIMIVAPGVVEAPVFWNYLGILWTSSELMWHSIVRSLDSGQG